MKITTDGSFVASDLFYLTGTRGLPLEEVLFVLKQRGFTMDWLSWMTDALKDGWKPKTIKSKMISAIEEVYGQKYCNGFENKLKEYL